MREDLVVTGGEMGAIYTVPRTFRSASIPKAICAKHGEHERHNLRVYAKGAQSTGYIFCPFCYGEWMAEQFPVTEVVDASHEPR